MMSEVTFDELRELIGEIVDLTGIVLDEDVVIGEDLSLDSQEMLRVLSRIESRHGFRFTVPEIARLKTLGDLLKTTQQRAADRS